MAKHTPKAAIVYRDKHDRPYLRISDYMRETGLKRPTIHRHAKFGNIATIPVPGCTRSLAYALHSLHR